MFRLRQRQRRGFTLLELIVVIVILGVLAALAIPTFKSVITNSQDKTSLSSLQAIGREAQALKAFSLEDQWSADVVEQAITDTSTMAYANISAAANTKMTANEDQYPPSKDDAGKTVNYYIYNDPSDPNYGKYEGSLLLSLRSSSGNVAAVLVSPESNSSDGRTGEVPANTSSIVLFDKEASNPNPSEEPSEEPSAGLAAPTNIAAALTLPAINVSWDAVEGAENYAVERSTDNGATWTAATTATETAYSETSLTEGTTYMFRVKAVKGDQSSEYATTTGVWNPSMTLSMTYSVPSDALTVAIPARQTGTGKVSWGDGEVSALTANASHTYQTAGTYTVEVYGTYKQLNYNGATGLSNLVSVNSWSDESGVQSMYAAFYNAKKLTTVPNHLPPTVTNTGYMFSGASSFNSDISGWDTSEVTLMNHMFQAASVFNQPIGSWKTMKVENMRYMFAFASAFDQPIGGWDTGEVKDMSYMFMEAANFNQNINTWNVSNVETLQATFAAAKKFNQPLNNWNTMNVKTMWSTFSGAEAFNQNINTWNTAKVTDMANMFTSANAFNQPLNNWNTGAVTTMSWMFMHADSFNQPISNWNTSKVENFSMMFGSNAVFNQSLNGWDTSSAKDMSFMFSMAKAFNGNISNWDVSNVENMYSMFDSTPVFNQNISSWNTAKVTDMKGIFSYTKAFNQDLSGWNVSNVTAYSEFDYAAQAWQASYKPHFG